MSLQYVRAVVLRLTYYVPSNTIDRDSVVPLLVHALLFEGGSPPRFRAFEDAAVRKLAQLDAANTLEFLRSPPGNQLQALRGDRKMQHSIRINDQFRLCFVWTEAGPTEVEIVDYHRGIMMSRPVNRMRPVHPGEILRDDFLAPLEMSVNALALALGVPATRIHEIVKERRSITADTAERLARYFGGDAESWMSLQATYDLKTLPTRDEIRRRVEPRRASKRAA